MQQLFARMAFNLKFKGYFVVRLFIFREVLHFV